PCTRARRGRRELLRRGALRAPARAPHRSAARDGEGRDSGRRVTSAVIPNWNGRRWLPGCLASIAAQTMPFAETIVVDNGSTDGSLEYLAAEHPHVRVIALDRNTGFAHAANRGIEATQEDYV